MIGEYEARRLVGLSVADWGDGVLFEGLPVRVPDVTRYRGGVM